MNEAHERTTSTFKYDSGPKPSWQQPHCDPPSVEINGMGCLTPN
jgi:hypothetical protein